MKKLLSLLALAVLMLSCSKKEETKTDPPQQQEELEEEQATIKIEGANFGSLDFNPTKFDDFTFRETYRMELEDDNGNELEITLITKGGFEPGTIKTIGESDGIDINEIYFDSSNGSYYESVSGKVTITNKKDYELFGGAGSGVALSGTISITADTYQGGDEITITGAFTDVKVLVEG